MAGPCQNKGGHGAGVGNGRRWDERKGRDGPKWPAPARIRGEGKEKWSKKKAETDQMAGPCQNKG